MCESCYKATTPYLLKGKPAMKYLKSALSDLNNAISNLNKEYGYERYTILLAHVKQELQKDIARIEEMDKLEKEREENQIDITRTYKR